MITAIRILVIIIMSAFLVVAAMNYKYFVCGASKEFCVPGSNAFASYIGPSYSQSFTSGGDSRER
ncbi:MAG: hypothetical protein KJ017_11225 [Alphaproteobacteria bacterium]|nr:hypothetical protein [Alphaproteobacteria bacterium]